MSIEPFLIASLLFLGDSHVVGTFGQTVDQGLRGISSQVTTLGSCGSVGRWWLKGTSTSCGYFFHRQDRAIEKGLKTKTPMILDELAAIKPEWVVVEIGGNYVPFENNASIQKDLLSLIEPIQKSGAQCILIGLPEGRKNITKRRQISALIRQTIAGKCLFFDSIPHTPYPATGGDGSHYETPEGKKIARKWAGEVLQFISKAMILNPKKMGPEPRW